MISFLEQKNLINNLIDFANSWNIKLIIKEDMPAASTIFHFYLDESTIFPVYIIWPEVEDEETVYESITSKVLEERKKHKEEKMINYEYDRVSPKKIFEDIICMSHYKSLNETYLPSIKKVIFNDPATIVIWADGTKTVVKCDCELYDPEKGLAMAISKKALGNNGNYYETFKKWVPEKPKPIDILQDMYRKKTKKRSR